MPVGLYLCKECLSTSGIGVQCGFAPRSAAFLSRNNHVGFDGDNSGEGGGTEAGRAKLEAVAVLGQFLLQVHNGGLLGVDDVSGHVLFLTGLITYPVTPSAPIRRLTSSRIISDPPGAQHSRNNCIYKVTVQRLTFVAIGRLVSQARPLVSDETWRITIQTLRIILESLASKKTLVEDCAASRYYVDLLRCVYIVVSKPEWCLKEHVGAFVSVTDVLPLWFKPSQRRKASCSSIWQEDLKDSRRTCCLDFDGLEELAEPVLTNGENVLCISDKAESKSSKFLFDTVNDIIPSDLPDEESAFLYKNTKLRLYSISTIQAMARGDPEGAKNRAALLLLADKMMQRRSEQATLLTVLLSDPMPKFRAAAATTLAVMQLYRAALKALSPYIATAPKRLRESTSFINHSSVKIAAIACLKAALSIWQPAPANVQGLVRTPRSADNEQLVHTAIEVLDELLRFASDSGVPMETLDSRSLMSSSLSSHLPVMAPDAPKLNPRINANFAHDNDAADSDSMAIEQSHEEDGCLQWLLALERLLPGVLGHSSRVVRGAAFSCFFGLTPAVFYSLPAAKQEFILSAIIRASQSDETPAVRLAACRAVGVIVGFPQVSKRKDQVAAFVKMLLLTMEDTLAPVCAKNGFLAPSLSMSPSHRHWQTFAMDRVTIVSWSILRKQLQWNVCHAVGNLFRNPSVHFVYFNAMQSREFVGHERLGKSPSSAAALQAAAVVTSLVN